MIVKYNPATDITELVNEPGMVLRTHKIADCSHQEACCIHRPSNHPLRHAPLNWRSDRGLMERICEHGVGHPDVDDLAHKKRVMEPGRYESYAFEIHGCDGCCFDTERVGGE